MRRLILALPTFLMLVLLALVPAQAMDVSVLFTPVSQTAAPGDTLTYAALFTNNTATDLWISNATYSFSDVAFPNSGSSVLFQGDGNIAANGAFKLAASQTLTVTDVLSVTLDSSLPVNTYNIDATFTGKDYVERNNSGVFDRDLGTGSFTVAAAPIPEPAFYQMSALLLLGGLAWSRTRKKG